MLRQGRVRITGCANRQRREPHGVHVGLCRQQRASWSIDPDQPLANVRTLDEVLAASMAQRRFNMTRLASIAVLALGLALISVYGTTATTRSAVAQLGNSVAWT